MQQRVRHLAMIVLGPLVLASCASAGATPFALRCHDDIDEPTCRERAAELSMHVVESGTAIESIDIGRDGWSMCWDRPGEGGCMDGSFSSPLPDAPT